MSERDKLMEKLPEGYAVVSYVDDNKRDHVIAVTTNFSSLNLVAAVVEQVHGNSTVEYSNNDEKKK